MNKFLFLKKFYDVNNKRSMDPFLWEFVGNKTLFYIFLSLIKVPFAAAHPYQLPIQVTPPPQDMCICVYVYVYVYVYMYMYVCVCVCVCVKLVLF